MPGTTASLDAPYQILVLSSGAGLWCSLLQIYAVCDVIISRHIHVCKPMFWWSVLTQHAYSGTSEQRLGRGSSKNVESNGNL